MINGRWVSVLMIKREVYTRIDLAPAGELIIPIDLNWVISNIKLCIKYVKDVFTNLE